MGRGRSKKMTRRESSAVFNLLLIGLAIAFLKKLFDAGLEFWNTESGKITVFTVLGVIFCFLLVRMFMRNASNNREFLRIEEEQQRELAMRKKQEEAIATLRVSDERADYIIEKDDYKRGNRKERLYRKMFKLPLLGSFDNKCAKCCRNDNGVDLDHFFMSKNAGGCFIMRHVSGHLVNNAIPLCETCNRSKSDKPYGQFFSAQELIRLFEISATMTKQLNEANPLAIDEKQKTKKPAAA